MQIAAQRLGLRYVHGLQGEALDRRGGNGRLGRPAAEDGGLGDAGANGEPVEREPGVAAGGEQLDGGLQYAAVGAWRRPPTASRGRSGGGRLIVHGVQRYPV